jgi:phosphate transport system ATP-binding protein
MVFQTPNLLPMNIYKNMAFPLKIAGIKDKKRWMKGLKKHCDRLFYGTRFVIDWTAMP